MSSRVVYNAFKKWRNANQAFMNANQEWSRRYIFYPMPARLSAPELRARNNASVARTNAFKELEAAFNKVKIPLYSKWLQMHKRRLEIGQNIRNLNSKITRNNTPANERNAAQRALANLEAERNRLRNNEPALKRTLNALTGRRLAKPTNAELTNKFRPELISWRNKALMRPSGIGTLQMLKRRRTTPISEEELAAARRTANRREEHIRYLLAQLENARAATARSPKRQRR